MPATADTLLSTIDILPSTIDILPESAVKLSSWHELVIAKLAMITARRAVTDSNLAISINAVSALAALASLC